MLMRINIEYIKHVYCYISIDIYLLHIVTRRSTNNLEFNFAK